MSFHIQASPLCVAVHHSPCGVFQAHWLPYGQTKYFAPVLIDTRTGHLFRAVIPHDGYAIAFVPAHARAPRTSPVVRRIEDIEHPLYSPERMLAEFADFVRGAA